LQELSLGYGWGVRYNFKVAQFLKDFGVSAEIAPYFAMFLIFVACILVATLIARFLKNVSVFVEITDNILGAFIG
jgi:hypothetical protein